MLSLPSACSARRLSGAAVVVAVVALCVGTTRPAAAEPPTFNRTWTIPGSGSGFGTSVAGSCRMLTGSEE